MRCSVVAARARFEADRSREQRKARAPTVKSLSRCEDAEDGETRWAIREKLAKASTEKVVRPLTELRAASQQPQAHLQ